jgi:hypothetical protein
MTYAFVRGIRSIMAVVISGYHLVWATSLLHARPWLRFSGVDGLRAGSGALAAIRAV